VDTNIFVAALNERDSDHDKGREILSQAFLRSKWLYTSDYVLDECISVAWSRTRKFGKSFSLSLVQKLDDTIQDSARIRLEKVNETDFATAKAYLRRHSNVVPKLTDWTSIVIMRKNHIDKILSLDGDFESVNSLSEFKWVERIDQAAQLESILREIF
jgi:predicted nucleic acid-binding protein